MFYWVSSFYSKHNPSKFSILRQSFMPIRDSSTRNPRPPTRMYSTLINSGRIIAFLQLSLFFLLHPTCTLLIQLLVLLFDLASSLLGIASASGTIPPQNQQTAPTSPLYRKGYTYVSSTLIFLGALTPSSKVEWWSIFRHVFM